MSKPEVGVGVGGPHLTFNEYQGLAAETSTYGNSVEKILSDLTDNTAHLLPTTTKLLRNSAEYYRISSAIRLSYTALGLGEVGEVQGKIKKIIRDSGGLVTESDRIAITKELGDVLWYVAMCAMEIGINLNEVALMNLEKLQSRKERGTLSGSGDDR